MNPASGTTPAQRWIEHVAHPVLLVGAYLLWLAMNKGEAAVLVALVAAFAVLMLLEAVVPAVPHWRLRTSQRVQLAGLYLLTLVLFGVFNAAYDVTVVEPLASARDRLGLSWPVGLPLLAQVLLLFAASDFVYYWIHRAIHRWGWFWKFSGHGFHHAFQNMHALNVGANHPFELLYLSLPLVCVATVFGVPGEIVAGADVLLVVNAAAGHANVRMDTPVLNWLITSANQHRRHHSAEFAVSNTNFSCNVILWDRLFGTFSEGDVQQTGIGPGDPTLWQKFMLPFREPEFADTAATRVQRRPDDQPA